jgi:asparagine synthase (glutamine-hydrolysing)
VDSNPIYENDLGNAIEKQALFDLKYYLPDDLLVKVDRSSMQYALEVRVPLLDHRIIEFTQNLHHTLKLRNGESKYLLKKVLFEKIPEKYFQHPKWGFGIPLSKWLSRELSYLIDKYLSKEAVEGVNVFQFSEVLNYVSRFRKGEGHLYNRLWAMILIQKSLID